MKISKPLKKQPSPIKNSDPEVKCLQRELKALGFDIGEDGIDGKFGKDTENALRAAQEAYNDQSDIPFEGGCVDENFARILNEAFDKTQIGQIINNRRKKFENKCDAIKELDKVILEEKKGKPNRVRLAELYKRKYNWLMKKLEEVNKSIWQNIPGYANYLPLEKEFFAKQSYIINKIFCNLLKSEISRIEYKSVKSKDYNCFYGSPRPDNPDANQISISSNELLNNTIFFKTEDLLHLPFNNRSKIVLGIKSDLIETKTSAIENLIKLLSENNKATLEQKDDWRKDLDWWRGKLDEELLDLGNETTSDEDEDSDEPDLVSLLIQYEELRLHVYNDASGKPTIGAGHLITKDEKEGGEIIINGIPIPYKNGLTEKQAKDLLLQDLERFSSVVDECVRVNLNPCQRAALISFAFNVGIGYEGSDEKEGRGFKGSTLLKRLNNGKFDEVPIEMRKWNKITKDGKKEISSGLVKRREKEIKLWHQCD